MNQRNGDSGIDPASLEMETCVADEEEFKLPYGLCGLSLHCGCSSQWAAQIASKLLCLKAS